MHYGHTRGCAEKLFFIKCYKTIDDPVIRINDVIKYFHENIDHRSRAWYYLKKWCGLGFYEYQTDITKGHLIQDKIPEEYLKLLNESKGE